MIEKRKKIEKKEKIHNIKTINIKIKMINITKIDVKKIMKTIKIKKIRMKKIKNTMRKSIIINKSKEKDQDLQAHIVVQVTVLVHINKIL